MERSDRKEFNRIMKDRRKLDLLCVLCGIFFFLFLPPFLYIAATAFHLKGGVHLLLLQCPVHLGVIFSILALTKRLCPGEKIRDVLQLKITDAVMPADIMKRFLVMFAAILVSTILMDKINQIFNLGLPQQPLIQEIQKGTPDTIAAIFFSAVILAPISEELLFRGALFRLLRESVPEEKEAIAATAFLFALIHWNTLRFLPLFIMGFLLQKACTRTKSLIPAILMHSLNNCIAVLCVIVTVIVTKKL